MPSDPTSSSTAAPTPRSTPASPIRTPPSPSMPSGTRHMAEAAAECRRPHRLHLHRLRLRRHARPPLCRVGRAQPAVGLRAEQARRRARGAPRCAGASATVVRTAWVSGAHGANMVKTVLRLAGVRPRRHPPVRRRPARVPHLHRRPGPGRGPPRPRSPPRDLPRHQPGRDHLVRLRPGHPGRGRSRPGSGGAHRHRRSRSAPPGTAPGQLTAGQRRTASVRDPPAPALERVARRDW